MSRGSRSTISLILNLVALVVLIGAFVDGQHPPAQAQEVFNRDSLQDERIQETNTHLQATDTRADKQWTQMTDLRKLVADNRDEVESLRRDYAHTTGIMWGIGTVIILLLSGNITLQLRSGKA